MKNRDLPATAYSGNIDETSLSIDDSWGLTKREYFAGLAMSAMKHTYRRENIAKCAVLMADALLNELEKES